MEWGRTRARALLLLVGLLGFMLPGAARAGVILQYFDGRWDTIEKRMPDIFMAGYDALWLPPPGVADSGGYSVGYDVYDRFNLGTPYWQSLYGTTAQFQRMLGEAHRSGCILYTDMVLNHNGYRDASTAGFVAAGDYPGFVTTLSGDVDGDFHGAFDGGDILGRLAGLIDIAQEKNHVFIRQPVTAGDPQNIPNETPLESNRQFYPDTNPNSPAALGNTAADRKSPSGFNLDHPLAGDPVAENATGLLIRHVKWMHEVMGVDGFRLDAPKHIPTWFFNNYYDPALYGTGPGGSTPYSFGEVFDGDFDLLGSYTRKDGYGNRDVLDFPLYFRMNEVFNAGGYGDMSSLEYASFDGSDGNANDGSRGVMFVQSHDNFGPAMGNLGYAHILTRPGYPVVYFNAKEFGNGRDFPKDGRGDALGGLYGETITRLIDIHRERARGLHATRWVDGDVYIYERENALLVGLNDNGAFAATRTVSNLGFRNVQLVELTGNAGASSTVNVDANGLATVTIPAAGYAMWSLRTPRGQTTQPLTLTPVAAVLPAETPTAETNGTARLTPLDRITGNSVTLQLQLAAEGLDDSALFKVDAGVDVSGTAAGGGEFAAYRGFAQASPSATGGTGLYRAALDLAALDEGTHYIEAVAFLQRTPNTLPPLFETFRRVIYLDRVPPPVTLAYPSQTGAGDVYASQYEVVLRCPDSTANAMHVLVDFSGTDAAARAAVASGNAARRQDRGEFRFTWSNITPGLHSLTVVAYEPSGNSSVTRFNNIDALVPVPDTQFRNLPDVITQVRQNDIQIWVSTDNPRGGADYVFNPASAAANAFRLQLTVNGTVYQAQPYNAALIGTANTLYQNDTDLGDSYDVFRFNWRGYGPGASTFVAKAELFNTTEPIALTTRTVTVDAATPGPDFSIVSPAPPASDSAPPTTLLNNPAVVSVVVGGLSPEVRSLTAWFQNGERDEQFAFTTVAAGQTSATLTSLPGALEFFNGACTIRVVATSAEDGGGLSLQKSTRVLVIGAQNLAQPLAPVVVDGQINDWPGTNTQAIHTTAVVGREWIYRGDVADCRTDLGDDTNIANQNDLGDRNMDLTQLRVRASAEKLYFMARFRDLNDVKRASLALGIDTNHSPDATSLGFIGDDSATNLNTSGRSYDYAVQVHFTNNSVSRVEVFDDVDDATYWFSPEGEESYLSAENDALEFAIPRAALGITTATTSTITIQGATFENQLTDLGWAEGPIAWNNNADSTRDIGGVSVTDAVDVLGGQPGVAANAYTRANFAAGNTISNPNASVVLAYTITIPPSAQSDYLPAPAIISVTPADGLVTPDAALPMTIVTDPRAKGVIVAVNGTFATAYLVQSDAGTSTWALNSPALRAGLNTIEVVAFENATLSGQATTALLSYHRVATSATGDWLMFE